MVKELFGQYLVRKGKVTPEDIDEALMLQEILQDSLGAVALANDVISYKDVSRILERMDKSGGGFAESAVALGILSEEEIEGLRSGEEVGRIRIGQLLVATARLSREELEEELELFLGERLVMHSANITRSGLVEQVAERSGLGRKTVRQALDAILDTVSEALEGGSAVKIRGFGTFRIRELPARKARNPRTGETMHLPARRRAHLEFAGRLRQAVGTGKGN